MSFQETICNDGVVMPPLGEPDERQYKGQHERWLAQS